MRGVARVLALVIATMTILTVVVGDDASAKDDKKRKRQKATSTTVVTLQRDVLMSCPQFEARVLAAVAQFPALSDLVKTNLGKYADTKDGCSVDFTPPDATSDIYLNFQLRPVATLSRSPVTFVPLATKTELSSSPTTNEFYATWAVPTDGHPYRDYFYSQSTAGRAVDVEVVEGQRADPGSEEYRFALTEPEFLRLARLVTGAT